MPAIFRLPILKRGLIKGVIHVEWPDPATLMADLRQTSALPAEGGRRHAEISAALADEMGRIGQADPQSDAADTDVIEPHLTQHPARDRHPAIVQQTTKRQAGIVEAAMH